MSKYQYDWAPPTQNPVSSDPTQVLWRRLLAAVIDSVLLFVLTAVVELPAGTPDECPVIGNGTRLCLPGARSGWGWVFLALIVGSIYTVVLEGLTGATVGKRALGIRVVDEVGAMPVGIERALVRHGFSLIEIFTLYIPLFVTKGHRRVGDLVAGTYVVSKEAVRHPIAELVDPRWVAWRSGWLAEKPRARAFSRPVGLWIAIVALVAGTVSPGMGNLPLRRGSTTASACQPVDAGTEAVLRASLIPGFTLGGLTSVTSDGDRYVAGTVATDRLDPTRPVWVVVGRADDALVAVNAQAATSSRLEATPESIGFRPSGPVVKAVERCLNTT